MDSLTRRTYVSVIGTLIFVWIFLFIPAWSLSFWQAWIYWGAFSIPVIVISLYFLKKNPVFMESRLKAGPTAEKELAQKIIQFFLSLFFIALLVIPGFDYRLHWSFVPIQLVIGGDILVLLGFWAVHMVFNENTFASATIQIHNKQKVISTGLYKYVRHPMYAGAGILIIGTPLALGSYWAFLPVLGMGVGVVFRLLHEERYLLQHLPGYKKYCEKVKHHLIPFVW
ncbi:MAG: isoprenylcysteine carboxylmethyltransferase family protein [Candidatus Roizmanbacteria bacterium]|nr:isoprenylcysteine carboxylmethyltransferase family protein [Candidatus Roizmanbacteria bacterium]